MSTPVFEQTQVTNPTYDDFTIEDLFPYEEPTDKNTRAHIVNPPMNKHIDPKQEMNPQDIVDTARLQRLELVALCGYKWVPKLNPDKLDVCPACMKIAEQLMAENGE